jgi:hypothetical protein
MHTCMYFLRALGNKYLVCLHGLISWMAHATNYHQTDLQVHRDNHNLRFKGYKDFFIKWVHIIK